MSGNSIAYKLLVIVLIICVIVVPVLTNEPLDKSMAIMFLICVSVWLIAGFIADIRDSSELETKIKSLEDRVKELEDKTNETR